MTDHTVRPGQIYQRADDASIQVRILDVAAGSATIGDLAGRYPRTVRLAVLHGTATTRTGAQRRTGYVLSGEAR